jgi:hypothetical protein
MNVRNARVEQAVEPFYQPENFELQLIRTHDSSLDRGVHRRCVTACCQDTDTFHNWTAKVFTIWSPWARVYLFRRIENDLHCGDTSVLGRLQGFLNLFHTNAILKNLEVLQLDSFSVFSAAGEGMRRDSWNRFKTGHIRWGQRAGWEHSRVRQNILCGPLRVAGAQVSRCC